MSKTALAMSEAVLITNVRTAWSSITSETLNNLMTSIPGRMRVCIREYGSYICQLTENLGLTVFILWALEKCEINYGTPCIRSVS